MESTYTQFLAAPNSSLLAADASLHYVTTTTAIRGATEIMKHLTTLRNQIKKSGEEVLEVIEGRSSNVMAAQFKTSITFVASGGPYLPGLDDNFLADREVRFPIMHIVTFDGEGKIAQIRQSWDQGSLLKQIEVIGRSGRNWPISSSDDQLSIISTCVKAVTDAGITAPAAADNRSRGNSANAFGDPHSSLELFTSRVERDKPDRVVSPYAGTRPRERSIHQILGEESDDETHGRPVARNQSPSKAMAKAGAGKNYPNRLFNDDDDDEEELSGRGRKGHIAPKAGAGKAYPNRLFESDEPIREESPPPSKMKAERVMRAHPSKYDHFDMADADNASRTRPGADRSRSTSKHDGSGNFDDFSTPHQALPSRPIRRQDARQWDPEADAAETAAYVPMGRRQNTGETLGNVTNQKDRRKQFDSHWDMNDESEDPPVSAKDSRTADIPDEKPANRGINIAGDGMGSRRAHDAGGPASKKIHIAGDGMGGRKGTDRNWLYHDED